MPNRYTGRIVMGPILENNPKFARFISGLSNATARTYAGVISGFIGPDVDRILTISKAERRDILETTIMKYNQAKKSKSFTRLSLTAVKSFLYDQEVDDGELFWRNLHKKIRNNGMPSEDQSPPPDIVRSFIQLLPFRDQTITIVACSSGIRIGGIIDLRVEDYTRLGQCGQIIVYRNDHEARYTALCSLEACDMLDRYLSLRKQHGEEVSPSSWLFRNLYDPQYPEQVEDAKKLGTTAAIQRKFQKYWHRSGLRAKPSNGGRIYQFKSVHGFRKFFRTQLTGQIPDSMIERLMGHSNGLVDNYYNTKGSEAWNKLVEQYCAHQESLAIQEQYRRKAEFQHEVSKIADLATTVQGLNQVIESLKDRLAKTELELELRRRAKTIEVPADQDKDLPTMGNCPNCHHEVNDALPFCPYCGAGALAQMPKNMSKGWSYI